MWVSSKHINFHIDDFTSNGYTPHCLGRSVKSKKRSKSTLDQFGGENVIWRTVNVTKGTEVACLPKNEETTKNDFFSNYCQVWFGDSNPEKNGKLSVLCELLHLDDRKIFQKNSIKSTVHFRNQRRLFVVDAYDQKHETTARKKILEFPWAENYFGWKRSSTEGIKLLKIFRIDHQGIEMCVEVNPNFHFFKL